MNSSPPPWESSPVTSRRWVEVVEHTPDSCECPASSSGPLLLEELPPGERSSAIGWDQQEMDLSSVENFLFLPCSHHVLQLSIEGNMVVAPMLGLDVDYSR